MACQRVREFMCARFEPNWVVLQSACQDALAQCSENSSSNEYSYDVITVNKHKRGTCTCILASTVCDPEKSPRGDPL
jgi:hypothetical protein